MSSLATLVAFNATTSEIEMISPMHRIRRHLEYYRLGNTGDLLAAANVRDKEITA